MYLPVRPIAGAKKLCTAFFALTVTLTTTAQQPIFNFDERVHPVYADEIMVSTQEKHATEAALEVLTNGGNAVDAAVTAALTMSVTLPRAGSLGGGGFMLIHLESEGKTVALDYREKAPLKAFREMMLDEEGEPSVDISRYSPYAVGVPGNIAGLYHALEKYGTLSWEEALQPAIELAEEGFPVSYEMFMSLLASKERFANDQAAIDTFYTDGGNPAPIGSLIRQPDLARTLRLLAEEGPDAFYNGEIGKALVRYMEENGGLITMEDLRQYNVVEREPIRGTYRGYEVLSMPPPSSGGIHIVQILNILEGFDLATTGPNTAKTLHYMVEAMKLAYADRSLHLGDSDFVPVPIAGLISKAYADSLRGKIDPDKARPSKEIKPGAPPAPDGGHNTTHFSVVDRHGNAVSSTYSINFSYGAHIMVPGTGILLNNTMDDFSAKPGEMNAYGLIGGEANAIEPEKRMLSSMSPTIVLDGNGEVFLVTGSPGGSRIISIVVQMILNTIDHDLNLAEATYQTRIHHQWLPDVIYYEKDLNADTRRLLEEMGHTLEKSETMGATQSILRAGDKWSGASDPRRPDSLTKGE